MKWIWKFHSWYDARREPWRFLLMLLFVIPFITCSLWVNTIGEAAFVVAYVGVLLGTRIWHVEVRCHGRRRRRAE